MMIQKMTFLRRTVGALLVALVALVGFNAGAQSLDFTATTNIEWTEAHAFDGDGDLLDNGTAGNSLTALNDRMQEALDSSVDYSGVCFKITGTPAAALGWGQKAATPAYGLECKTKTSEAAEDGRTGESDGSLDDLVVLTGKHIDREQGESQILYLEGFKDGKSIGKLTINITVTNYIEQAVAAKPEVATYYLRKNDTKTVLISNVFKSDEGSAVSFDSGDASYDVWVCDSDAAGDIGFDLVAPDLPITTQKTDTLTSEWATAVGAATGATGALACAASNKSLTPGAVGAQVLTTRKIGPILQISTNSLQVWADGNTNGVVDDGEVTSRPRGTYLAKVFFRVWSDGLVSSNWGEVNVFVKEGANNVPQFAGGATGFTVELDEPAGQSENMTAWVAGDLDEESRGGAALNMKDVLSYKLSGDGKGGGGSVSLVKTPATPGAIVTALALKGKDLDFEAEGTSPFTVMLEVTDNWSDPVSVPITVTVKDVNELEKTKKTLPKTIQLIAGESVEFDLNDYFHDPEDDAIVYEAYSDQRLDVAVQDKDAPNMLTINGKGTSATTEESSYKVTVSATDGKLTETAEIIVKTRHTNDAPKITHLENGVVSIGTWVDENTPNYVLLPLIAYTDDDPKNEPPTPLFDGKGLFEAKINPCVKDNTLDAKGCTQHDGSVAIVVGEDGLDFESAPRHTLTLQLQDSWEPDTKITEELVIEVAVGNKNDAPQVVEGSEIDDQMIVVAGSGSLPVGMYFEDEDAENEGSKDTRLLVSAKSSDSSIVDVKVSGLDTVVFSGESVGEATITLFAEDADGLRASMSFKVEVGENNAPVKDEEAFMARLPADNTINLGETFAIELDGLFSEPDGGDMIVSTVADAEPEDTLLVVTSKDGSSVILVGRGSGEATLTITAKDEAGNETPHETMITVNAEPEEAMPFDPQTFTRVTPLALDVSATFSDSDDGADSLVIAAEVIGDGSDRVIFSEVVDGMLTITGVAGATPGDLEIRLTATDPHGSSATSTFVATIENVNPTVAEAVETEPFDRIEPLAVDLNATFADEDGAISMIVAAVEEDSIVSVSEIDLEDGLLTVTALDVGEATVSLTATDDNGGTVTTDFAVTVNNVAPTVAEAIADQTTTRVADPMLTVDAASTFSDPDTDEALELAVTSGDDAIAAVAIDDGTITVEGLNVGTATITVTATDMDGGMVSTDFAVEVENIKPTVAMSVDDQSFDRRAPLGIDLSGTFADEDMDAVTITAVASDDSVITAMMDGTDLTLTALAVGTSTVTLTATDANGGMVASDFAVEIVNIAPVVANAVADQSTTRLEDLMIDVSDVFNDPDQTNDDLTITVATEDGAIVESMLDGTMLTLKGLAVGATSVTLTATDADGGMASNMFTTTIENVEPVVANAVADITDLDRRAPATIDLSNTFSDADGTLDTIDVAVSDSAVVDATLDASMMLTVTALAVGESTVTLTATDANGASIADDFNVTVVNIAPVVANSVPDQTTTRVQDITLDVSGVFADPDQDDSMLTLAVTTADGSIVDATLSGSSLTIQGLAVGDTDLTLTATDMDDGMATSAFNVRIDNVAPQVAGSLSPVTLEVGGQPASQSIAGLFSDDGDPLTYAIASSNSGVASTSLTGMTATVAPVSRGSATYTITATDVHGESASLTASVAVGDGELKAVAAKSLAGFGRALLASVSSSVGSRVSTDARAADLTLDAWAPTDDHDMHVSMTAGDRSEQAWNVVNTTTQAASTNANAGMATSGMDMLRSTFGESFALNLGSSDNPSSWSIWGDVDRQSYEGEGYDGMASSVYLGADVTVAECWLFGVAVSSNSGESDYSWGTATQTMDLSLTTVLPYISYQPTDRSSIWGVAGFGSGELDTTVQGASNDVSDLTSQILMVGGSQHLTNVGRFDLALKGDAASASLETEDGAGAADGLMADVSRIRAGLEGSFRTETGQGGLLEPFGQVSLRSDGGDGDTGTGIELAGGVRMTSDTFTLEVRGRTLAMHSADEYTESGFSLMATLNPSASATGVSVSIAPRWGADAQSSGMIWQDTLSVNPMQSYGVMTGFDNFGAERSVDAQVGYGMLVAQEQYLLTPFVDLTVSDGARREMLFGASLRQMVRSSADLDVQLALGRVEERTGDSSGKIGLNATLRF